MGDIPGITQHLDYLQSLHVTALWLSPFYPSPMADFGYDVADYCAVDPLFGTLEDFKELLAEAHARDMHVIIDLVPNHTSDEHPWFTQSRQSADNAKSDWYIWRDPKAFDESGNPLPPNNWLDVLSGHPAWQWDETRQQFYLHSFNVHQPDLNWYNNEVRDAFKDIMRFWLDMGVDGFRVDAVYWLAKEPLLSDDPPNPEYVEGEDLLYEALIHDNSCGWPPVYAFLTEMCDVLKEPAYAARQRFMVTEAYPERHNPLAAYLAFYVGMDPQVAAPFNFEGVSLPWSASAWRRFLRGFHSALDMFSSACVASYAFGNHDKPRLASRVGIESARSAAIMLMTLPGMAFIYYGEELGMTDVHIPPELVQDPAAKGDPKHGIGRDPERTPMQWSAAPHAGFSTGARTWLPVADDYATQNVETQSQDDQSFLSLYRKLGELRKNSYSLKHGSIEVHESGCPEVVIYTRREESDVTYIIAINFSAEATTCRTTLPYQTVVISSARDTKVRADQSPELVLQPHEAVILRAA